jgi:hypothetical protein
VQCSKVPRRYVNINYNETSLTKKDLRLLGAGGREEATGARPDFGLTPDQDPAIFSIWWDRVCSILTTPSVTLSVFFRI